MRLCDEVGGVRELCDEVEKSKRVYVMKWLE